MHAYMKELYVCMDTYVREPHEHSAVLLSVDECWRVLMSFDESPMNTRQCWWVLMSATWESNNSHICISYARSCGSPNVCTLCIHSETHTHTHTNVYIFVHTQNTFLPTLNLSLPLSLSLSLSHIDIQSVVHLTFQAHVLCFPPKVQQAATVWHTHTHSTHCILLSHPLPPPDFVCCIHLILYTILDETHHWRNT